MILRRRPAPRPADLDNMNSLAQAAQVLDIRLGLDPIGNRINLLSQHRRPHLPPRTGQRP